MSFRALCAAALLSVASAAPALAQAQPAPATRLDDIVAKGVLRVGTTGDYKPFT